MIKKCKVLNYNMHQDIVVIDFDGVQIQLASHTPLSKICYVKFDRGAYTLSSLNEYEKYVKQFKNSKKKIVDKVTNDEEISDDSGLI